MALNAFLHTRRDHDPAGSGTKRAGNTKPGIVVAVVGLVPVAVGRAEVLWIIVPGTAAQNAERWGPFRRRGATGARPDGGGDTFLRREGCTESGRRRQSFR